MYFSSFATNLSAGDVNNQADVFSRDRWTGTTTLISVLKDGQQGNGSSYWPSVSADSSKLVFVSEATNFIPGGAIPWNVYLWDSWSGGITLVSVTASGAPGPGHATRPVISGDGTLLVFSSTADGWTSGDTNGKSDIVAISLESGVVRIASTSSSGLLGDGHSFFPAVSEDGRIVAFESFATNLVAHDANLESDVFVHFLDSGVTKLVSVDSLGQQGNGPSSSASVSWSGGRIAFASEATNLDPWRGGHVNVFVRDLNTEETIRVSIGPNGESGSNGTGPTIDGRGRIVAFSSLYNQFVRQDNNFSFDVFVVQVRPSHG